MVYNPPSANGCFYRLFPAVPMNERTASKSTVLHSDGKKYYVPAGAKYDLLASIPSLCVNLFLQYALFCPAHASTKGLVGSKLPTPRRQ